MADDTRLNAGTAGDLIATDELTTLNGAAAAAGLKVQRIKVGFGTDNVLRDVDAANGLPVVGTFFQATQPVSGAVSLTANGLISTTNSTIVALAANATFTGPAEDVTDYADIHLSIISDQASAADGVKLQQSSNGTNWDLSDDYTVPANTARTFGMAASAKFYRVVFTNGAAAQTTIRLQTKFYKAYVKGSSVRPQDARTNDNDFEEMLAFSMGYNGVSWDRLRATVANGLAVDVTRLPALVASAATIGAVNIAAAQTLATVSAVTAITNALPTGANVIGALTANQTTNTAQIAGAATAAGSGVVTAGTQRTVLATDVPLPALSEMRAATLHISQTAAVNTAVTATLPAPAAGLFHYITSVQLVKVYNALGVAAGAGVVVTSSNLPGGPAWLTEQAAGAVGTAVTVINYQPATPLKAAAAALATTFVAPAQLQTIWRWNVSYFTAA